MLSVIIGRFQTPYLHAGHLKLISEAEKHGDKVLILIGTTVATGTDKNPLDYITRMDMIYNQIDKGPFNLKKFNIGELKDMPSDKDWSKQIDDIIANNFSEEAVIFGGRDHSLHCYSGKHKVKTIAAYYGEFSSSTELREYCAEYPTDYSTSDFRSGIIYNTQNRYPIVYSTVDVALIREPKEKQTALGYPYDLEVLMGNKGDGFHFIGGFVDPSDESYEAAAKRELKEETGISVLELNFLFSSKVNDKRYEGTKDSIMTNFFYQYDSSFELSKQEEIKDKEFKEFQWIHLEEKSLEKVSDTHKPLFKQLLTKI